MLGRIPASQWAPMAAAYFGLQEDDIQVPAAIRAMINASDRYLRLDILLLVVERRMATASDRFCARSRAATVRLRFQDFSLKRRALARR